MSNERLQNDKDPLVSASYRELASERSPQHLDDAILRKARASARPRYGRLRLWVRPAAWAATIAISLAIVLQVTQVPDPGVPASELQKPATEEEFRDETANDAVAEKAAAPDRRLSDAPAESADAFVPARVDALREAEDMARMQSGSVEEVALTATGPAAAAMEQKENARYCDDEARATAETWIECIEQLEADGKQLEARAERLVFVETHPDY